MISGHGKVRNTTPNTWNIKKSTPSPTRIIPTTILPPPRVCSAMMTFSSSPCRGVLSCSHIAIRGRRWRSCTASLLRLKRSNSAEMIVFEAGRILQPEPQQAIRADVRHPDQADVQERRDPAEQRADD